MQQAGPDRLVDLTALDAEERGQLVQPDDPFGPCADDGHGHGERIKAAIPADRRHGGESERAGTGQQDDDDREDDRTEVHRNLQRSPCCARTCPALVDYWRYVDSKIGAPRANPPICACDSGHAAHIARIALFLSRIPLPLFWAGSWATASGKATSRMYESRSRVCCAISRASSCSMNHARKSALSRSSFGLQGGAWRWCA